ncbi:hypothetical protein BHM03_00025196 [Ensete ventricosum]|nr:hypothetical protein BHM03_00025196 [Ensete ventricosum]
MPRAREDDFESKSCSENIEGASGDDQDQNQRPRKKRYHRHTQHQIQEMEAFFKECPHPDDKQRKELSRELGLEPLQNSQLRAENEKLRADNLRYKEALSNASCPNWIAAKYVGKPVASYPLLSPTIPSRSPLDLGVGGFGVQQGIGSEMFGAGDVDDPGRPPGIVLNAATSFWLPVPPKRVFDFLRDESSRSEVCLSTNSSQSNMLILQESCTDPTGSYVIYAPVDVIAMNVVLNGGDPDYVALLPSGFAILPDGPCGGQGGERVDGVGSGGSLLTVAFQILVDSAPTAKLSLGSVATVNSLIACTVERIKASVGGESAP